MNPDSCSNVRISDCHIDVGDDCITIKSGKETDGRQKLRACENITITNCTLVHGHGGVVIGSEMSGSVRNVAISNCVFVGTDRGIRLKGRRGRGGVVEDIRASNLIMDGVTCPIAINLFYGCGAWGDTRVNEAGPMPVDATTPRFRRLHFSGISARNVRFAAAYLLGLPEMYVEDVTLRDVTLRIDPTNTEAGDPDMSPLIRPTCRAGVVARNVRGLSMQDVLVIDASGPSVRMQDCEDVVLSGIHSKPGEDSVEAPIALRDVRDARITNSSFPRDTAAAVVVDGRHTRQIRLGENDCPDGVRRLAIGDDVPDGEVTDSAHHETPNARPRASVAPAVARVVGQQNR